MTTDEPRRVDLTAAAADLLRRLAGRHGPLMFHQSGGCCDGSSPMCYPDGEFQTGEADIRLSDLPVPGLDRPVPFWMSRSQYEYWKHTHLTVDVVPGRGSGFSVEAPDGVRFLIRSRLPTTEELEHFRLAGSAGRPLPGVSAALVDESGREVGPGSGLLALTRPWPSMLRTLYNDPDRYVQTYFGRFGPGTYFAGDGARRDEDGYFWITGRVDDVINVSGHRLSTAEIESALVSHPAVAEAAVIAAADDLTGQSVVAYVTLSAGVVADPGLETTLREHVGRQIGKLARPGRIIWADDLPKTRSGKIMRRLLRDIAEDREPGDVTTLRDPSVLAQLQRHARTGR